MGYDNLCGATTGPPQFSTATFVLISALFYIGLDWKNAIWVGPCNPLFTCRIIEHNITLWSPHSIPNSLTQIDPRSSCYLGIFAIFFKLVR
jgi:hypothetical protein